ncbi:hypothetical protein [Affinirhizobium pseudoryzae]|uniref:hypothetical protein n=1 Tax=Allorhizobium pseudoryzae TaxID=379684 RepID=UPI0013EA347C|nr:hypothetical protein [Allorhizobium pseudoryzae]
MIEKSSASTSLEMIIFSSWQAIAITLYQRLLICSPGAKPHGPWQQQGLEIVI